MGGIHQGGLAGGDSPIVPLWKRIVKSNATLHTFLM